MTKAILQLEKTRKELLDMGLRGNPLLSFQHSKAKTLAIVDELSSQLFECLVVNNKEMSFLPIPDSLVDEFGKTAKTQQITDMLSSSTGDKRHADLKLQTKLPSGKLDQSLLKIQTEANTYFQEQGIDILYLALGFVTWYEADTSDKARKAPLILVPVSLERSGAGERFKLRYTEADLGSNLTLAAKFKGEFHVVLPAFEDLEDVQEYFQSVDKSVKEQKRWSVNGNDIALGFFAFGKFQMYQDLAAENWPEDKQPGEHGVINALFGDGFDTDESEIVDDGSYEQKEKNSITIENLTLVKDSDSSQSEAVITARKGKNLVIQGPPGTGKSQTITNIISQFIADNKTVLFVSEKMAALDVVKRRLDETHLGNAVLELHSHKSNKKAVLTSLQAVLDQGKPQSPARHGEQKRLVEYRKELDSYCHQVNSPVLRSSTTYISALGHALNLDKQKDGQQAPDYSFTRMESWDDKQYFEQLANVTRLVAHIEQMGPPINSPFSSCDLRDFSPVLQQQVNSAITVSQTLLRDLMENSEALASAMSLPRADTLSDCNVIANAALRAIDAPDVGKLNLTADDWQLSRDKITSLINCGKKSNDLSKQYEGVFIDAIWQADLLPIRTAIASKGPSLFRFLSSDYRNAKQQLTGYLKLPISGNATEWVTWLDDILEHQKVTKEFKQYSLIGERIFATQWQGINSDWEVLDRLSQWVIETWEEISNKIIPQGILNFLQGETSLNQYKDNLHKMMGGCKELDSSLSNIIDKLSLSTESELLIEQPLNDLLLMLEEWISHVDSVYQMTRFNLFKDSFVADGLEEIASIAYSWTGKSNLLKLGFQLTWFQGLVNSAYNSSDAIKHFDRSSHEHVIHEFRVLDESLFNFAQEELVSELYSRLPSSNARGEMAILRAEFQKKRRHLPIRRLLEKAGRAIQQSKPVFMMSPMSVSTYLEPGAIDFDLVIFDEASQVKVADAIGPILRGKQVIVVGDTKQMPPTDFFSKSIEIDDEEAEQTDTADIESILGLFLVKGSSERMLKWHYRSRHESLIAVSNQEFYDNKLMIFPSPGVNPAAKGLTLVHSPETSYDRGGSRTNVGEANVIVEVILEHAKNTPHLTLGVVAFSTAQRDTILNTLEVARRQSPELEPFFAGNDQNELFFVKNLENVQGDERDVIFISIGYGRTQAGKMGSSFGPLNRQGGERRLNVLISRARMAMQVYCNFTADDLSTDESSPFGVKALKNFLHYAEKKELVTRHETGKEPDSPFEEEVISAIRGLGYQVQPQVGCSGFFLDIAVIDPHKPGRYILAVECDGATYHSSSTARDRDRIRQNVLEGLGWRFHRIWSTDWFRNANKETQRLHESIKQAVDYYIAYDEGKPESVKKGIKVAKAEVSIEREHVAESADSINQYKVFDTHNVRAPFGDIYSATDEYLSQLVCNIISRESPVHIKRITQVILVVFSLSRSGAKLNLIIDQACKTAVKSEDFKKRGEFYLLKSKAIVVRSRAELPANQRKIEWVNPKEIRLALALSVELSYSLSEDDAIAMSLEQLGFNRATSSIKSLLQIELQQLISNGTLKKDKGMLVSA
jgi:very-short-patch-repair endonuclease/DNA polymerase III delta prime subunit